MSASGFLFYSPIFQISQKIPKKEGTKNGRKCPNKNLSMFHSAFTSVWQLAMKEPAVLSLFHLASGIGDENARAKNQKLLLDKYGESLEWYHADILKRIIAGTLQHVIA